MTTIKVSPEVREQVAAIARERGLTANGVVELALTRLLREARIESVREAMARSPKAVVDSYWAEAREWDAVASDGLSEW